MIYTAGVPKILHIDNGKDYTKQELTGQNRKNRRIDFDFDAETVGFYQSIGIQEVGRSLPYQPWDKAIERFFGTVCSKFSKWFDSYTGTLTGSKTYAKRHKDVDRMLERGELLTMEEFFEVWTKWKETVYHQRKHGGLKENHEKWLTPGEVFANAPKYEKGVPPREYAAMLLMRADTTVVRNVGIRKFGVFYSDSELGRWVNRKVSIKWDIDDVTKLYVYDLKGRKRPTPKLEGKSTSDARKRSESNHSVPEQSLTVYEALRMCTYNGYCQSFDEKERGSLEIGKVADMVVLSESPYASPVDQLDRLKVEQLLLAGQPYQKLNGGAVKHILRGMRTKSV